MIPFLFVWLDVSPVWFDICLANSKNRKPSELTNKLLGPVVQSIVSLMILLKGQVVKCFTTL